MAAESEKPLAELYAEGTFPTLLERTEKFPEGESLDDLGRRASQALQELIMPHVWKAAREGRKGVHVAVVSHGLCISEFITMLLKKDAKGGQIKDYRGLMNTGWTRVTVDIQVGFLPPSRIIRTDQSHQGAKEGEILEFPDNDPPPLVCTVTDINQHKHINNIVSKLKS
jgi:broad specificity phosphatase PhoE